MATARLKTSAPSCAPRAAERGDPSAAWASFLERYTPAILGLIRRTGLRRRDEVMDVYVRVCEQLCRHNGRRLGAHDPSRGAIVAWLAVVVRRVAVDWVRTRAGRRRHFTAIRRLSAFDREVFELRYWQDPPSENLDASLACTFGRRVPPREIDAAIERVERALGERQRTELAASLTRAQAIVPIDARHGELPVRASDPACDPEQRLLVSELARELAALVRTLPADERAILQLKFVHGRSHREIGEAIGDEVTDDRVRRAVGRLRTLVRARGLRPAPGRSIDLGCLAPSPFPSARCQSGHA